MARLLIFDTAGAACSVALWADDGVAAERYEAMARGQAERLLPMIGEALAAAGISYAQLDGIGVTCGPGAFTGLRIGLAAARGLALTLGIPAIGITTFDALAMRAPAGCVVAIDTKRNDCYCQRFGPDGAAQGEPGILSPADAVALADSKMLPLVTDRSGPPAGKFAGDADGSPAGPPRAAAFASLVAGRFPAPGEDGPPMPRPLYLRAPEARLPEARTAGLYR